MALGLRYLTFPPVGGPDGAVARSSASENVELHVLRHEVTVLGRGNPKMKLPRSHGAIETLRFL